jgi:hypothetical protein
VSKLSIENASLRERLENAHSELRDVTAVSDANVEKARRLVDENEALKRQVEALAGTLDEVTGRLRFHERQALKSLRINHGLISALKALYDRDAMLIKRKDLKKVVAEQKAGPRAGDKHVATHQVGGSEWVCTITKKGKAAS